MSGAGRDEAWQRFFWSLFKRSRNAVALSDDYRRLVEVNGAFVRLTGRSRKELLRGRLSDLLAGGPQLSLREWRAMVRKGEWMGEAQLVRGDGTVVAVEYAAHPEVVTRRRLVLFVVLHSHRGGRRRHATGDRGRAERLTERERQIVHFVALGMTSREIAEELDIAPDTVRTHVRNAMTKMNARSRSQLVALSIGEGHLHSGSDK